MPPASGFPLPRTHLLGGSRRSCRPSSRPSLWPVSPLILLLYFAAFGGCSPAGRSPEAGEWVAVRDTVGDTLVVRTLSGSVWRDTAELVPEVTIGMLDGPEEYTFGQVVSLAMADDGTIYVTDGQAPALRVYNADGSYRTTFGRKGEGPGEYLDPDGGLGILSDGRVVLRDPQNARIQVFSAEGEPLDTWRIRGGFSTSRRMVVDRQDRSHALILLDPDASVLDWKMGFVRIDPDGTPGDTLEIPDLPWEEPTISASREYEDGGTSMSVNTIAFAPEEHAIVSPSGGFIHAISTDYALTVLPVDAPPLRIEKEYEPVPVSPGERAEEEAQAIRNMKWTDPNWRWNGDPIPEYKAPFDRFFAGEDGSIWVLLHQPGEKGEDPFFDPSDPDAVPDEWTEPVLFDVFMDDGTYLGSVRGPNGFRWYPTPIFTRDWVLGTVRDEFDVPRVIRFRVVRPGREDEPRG